MKNILLLLVAFSSFAFASLRVETTFATFGAIAEEVGGDLVHVHVLASAKYDPHFIVPKPSLLAKLHRADLLIMNGGGLELGWLPPLIRGANNANIQNGAKGFLDISHYIPMIDIPSSVSRGYGDVHAQGNPHYTTDPHMVPFIAKAISQKLALLDSDNSIVYQENLESFLTKWKKYLNTFDADMKECRDKNIVQYHELFNYFLKRYKYKSYGNIESLPGVAPSSKHTIAIINTIKRNDIKLILQDVYHERKTAKFIAAKTDAKVILLPHDIGADTSESLEEFYNNIAKSLCR